MSQLPLPHSLEAERAVLGGMLLGTEEAIEDLLDPGDFYRESHGRLFELLKALRERGEPCDTLAVVELIHARGDGEAMGGLPYVSALADTAPSTENVAWWAEQVAELSARRQTLLKLRRLEEDLSMGRCSALESREQLAALADDRPRRGDAQTSPIAEVLVEVGSEIDQEAAGLRRLYLPSGIPDLDRQPGFRGVSRDGVTLVIGQSGMGKTSYLNRLCVGLAEQGYRVCIYGTETNKKRRTRDLEFALAGVNMARWAERCAEVADARQRGQRPLPHQDWLRQQRALLRDAEEALAGMPVEVFESGWTVDRLCTHVQRRHRQGAVDVVIVDYLQDFVASRHCSRGNLVEQVSYSSKRLKDLSASLSLPIIVGAQRSGEKGQDISRWVPPRGQEGMKPPGHGYLIPQMQDVQHSSAAFQDAEEVYCLYRPAYFIDRYADVHTTNPFNWDCNPEDLKLVCRKRRVGGPSQWHIPFDAPSKWVGRRITQEAA